MGYLDNSAITVDAILTKQGRTLLAEGTALDISYFSLGDTGVDYTIWNTGHPSGSAYYGEAIENMPVTEAIPQAQYQLRNRLVTLPRGTTHLPFMHVTPKDALTTFTDNANDTVTFNMTLNNFAGSDSFLVVVSDWNLLNPSTGTYIPIAGMANSYTSVDSGVETAMMIAVPMSSSPGTSFPASALAFTANRGNKIKQVNLTFISVGTGAWASRNVQIPKATGDGADTIVR